MFENKSVERKSFCLSWPQWHSLFGSFLLVVCVQENPLMHNGHPCKDLYSEDVFQDGITNGAQWYSVPGKPTFIHPVSLYLFSVFVISGPSRRKQATKNNSWLSDAVARQITLFCHIGTREGLLRAIFKTSLFFHPFLPLLIERSLGML